jgi:hypothetical protein
VNQVHARRKTLAVVRISTAMNDAVQARALRELRNRIAGLNELCEQYLQMCLKREKAAYPNQPELVLRQILTRGDKCICRVVQRLIQEQKDDAGACAALRLDQRDGAAAGRQARPQAKA